MNNKRVFINKRTFFLLSLTLVLGFCSASLKDIDDQNNEGYQNLETHQNDLFTYEWNATWGGDAYEYIWDVKVGQSGNIYATGDTGSWGSTRQGILLNYASNGTLMWNQTWDSEYSDRGAELAIDSSNNIYVAGHMLDRADLSNKSAFLAKYDSQGDQIWNLTRRPQNYSSGFTGITLDSSENIITTGFLRNDTLDDKSFITKFSPNGLQLWNFSFGVGSFDQAEDLFIDDSSNFYITGRSSTGSNFLLKFDSNKNEVWNTTWSTQDYNYDKGIQVDSSGNIFIAEDTGDGGYYDSILFKFDPTGKEVWNKTWGGETYEMAEDLCIDGQDNIYVAGYSNSFGSGDFDSFLLKYSNSGDLLSNLTWGSDLDEFTGALDMNSTGEIYLAGIMTPEGTSSYDSLVVKFNIGETTSPTPPGNFQLSCNATNPDTDGNFTLNWTTSANAESYVIYRCNSTITKVNSSLKIIAENLTNSSYFIKNMNNGTYHFAALAKNSDGEILSNSIEVTVSLSPTDSDDGDDGANGDDSDGTSDNGGSDEDTLPSIPFGNFYLIFLVIGLVIILFKEGNFKSLNT